MEASRAGSLGGTRHLHAAGAVVLGGMGAWLGGAAPWAAAGVGVAFGALQSVVAVLGEVRRERLLLAPLRAVVEGMGEYCRSGGHRPVAPAGGPWARQLVRRWNEVVARTRELAREHDARLLATRLGYRRVRAVFDSLEEGVVVLDPEEEVVLVNPGAAAVLGRAVDAVEGRRAGELLVGAFGEGVRALIAEVSGSGHSGRARGLAHQGRLYDVAAVPVSSSEASELGTVLVLKDVSGEHAVRRAQDRFLSGVSHELRTPLTSICSYTEILQGMVPGADAEWPEFLRIVHEEGRRLSDMVDELLDFVRLEAGEVHWLDEELRLDRVAAGELDRVRPAAADRGLTLESDLQPCTLHGDPRWWSVAIRHLLANAVAFTPAGGRIRITLEPGPGDARLAVEDDGPGIPQGLREAVFEKFLQPQDHLTAKPAGLGLGLALCRLVVAHHGGTVHCDASPLGGARFHVHAPLPTSPAHPPKGVATADPRG